MTTPSPEPMSKLLNGSNGGFPQHKDSEMGGEPKVVEEKAVGLMSAKALTILALWYLFSFFTLMLNKYILTTLGADLVLFATVQLVVTTGCSFVNMYYPCGMYTLTKDEMPRTRIFYRNMVVVGATRFLVVFLGLVALKYVAVSFTETVKSSAPMFTVVLSRLMLGEVNGQYVYASLLPIMSGLALCSAYELSFDMRGFLAALGTNISECLQFVFSKLCISGEKNKTSPAEFQFYTCLASLFLQIPVCLVLADWDAMSKTTGHLMVLMAVNGVSYHLQTMMAWVLMAFVSPVTHSICNVVKRAILIWASVLVFGNAVTLLSAIGTAIVFTGVLLYNKAREYELSRRHLGVKFNNTNISKEVRQL